MDGTNISIKSASEQTQQLTKELSDKFNTGNILFYVLLAILSIIVVGYGHIGISSVKAKCEIVDERHPPRPFWKNERSVAINEKILSLTTGMGYGVIIFLLLILLFNKNCIQSTYLVLSIFLIVISSFLINRSQVLNETCSIQAKDQSNIIYGLLGSGLGMFVISMLYVIFPVNNPVKGGNMGIKNLIIMIFTSILLLIQSVVMVMNSNNCDTDKNIEYQQSTYNSIGYAISSFSVLFIILTFVYFFYKAKKKV